MIKLLPLLLLTACITTPQAPESFTSAFPEQAWTDFTAQEISAHGLDKLELPDAKEWCEQGMSKANWVALISAMSKRESNFKPASTYKENFKNSKGEYVISTGLMQISLESSRQSAYNCREFITKQSDLTDPFKNLKCSINIIAHWAKKDNKIGKGSVGAGRYWSVMRSSESVAKTKAVLKPLCR